MSYASLPSDVRAIAERDLTPKQLEAFQLECTGFGLTAIARSLGVTKTAIVSRLDAAALKLERAGVRQNSFGNWYLDKEAA